MWLHRIFLEINLTVQSGQERIEKRSGDKLDLLFNKPMGAMVDKTRLAKVLPHNNF